MADIQEYFNKLINVLGFYTENDLEKLSKNHNEELKKIKITHNNKLEQVQIDYENAIDENNKAQQNKLENTEIKYTNRIDDLISSYDNKLENAELDYKSKLYERNMYYKNKFKELQESYEKSLNKFTLNSPRLKFVEALPKIEKKINFIVFSKKDDEIKKFIELKNLGNPTDEQWKIILCKNSTQLVAAAAGSGKSTTMLLRIIVLIKFANVNPNELVVFSFTKKSCKELRDKLVSLFKKAKLDIDKSIIEKMIRTFHSKVYEVAKDSGYLGSYKLFEFIKDKDNGDNNYELDAEIDNTFNSTLNYAQSSILKEIYAISYSKCNYFKKLIHKIFLKSNFNKLLLKQDEKKGISQIKYALNFSEELCNVFKDVFKTTLDTNIKEKTFSKVVDTSFYYHLYLDKLDVYLIFSPENDILKKTEFKDILIENRLNKKQFKLLGARNIHKKVFSYCDSKVVFVETQQELNNILLINDFSDDSEKNDTPIIFDIKISTLSRKKLIYEFFYILINFIESTGISFEQLNSLKDKILNDSTFDEEHKDIYNAMMIYWEFMNKYFKENEIWQFSNLLKFFSVNNINHFDYTSTSIKSMKNILIDEFQDISPEIVSFIKGAQKYLYKEEKETTLMCIGDDWQSIYGWRGSTPSYLIKFKEHFNCEHNELVMSYNFRSSQNILSKAGEILNKVDMKLDKEVIAFNKHIDSEFKKINIENKSNKMDIKKVTEDINKRIIEIKNEWPDASIYVLCRQNSKDFNGIIGADDIMTFHSSKGLEADVCFLIGDCYYKEKDIIRNLIYRLAKYNQTYDESQRDEQLRLAYVAATRAKKYAYWYGLEESDFGYIFE